ncbi:MAG TPA: hypothetical protein VFF63_04240 [Candidatus Babeliales bacterium]|nr:hypothetical protein [Candidatus Babeliales bacterium]
MLGMAALIFAVVVAHPAPSFHTVSAPALEPVASRPPHSMPRAVAIPSQFPWRGYISYPVYVLPPPQLCWGNSFWGPWGLLAAPDQPFAIYSGNQFGSSVYGTPWAGPLAEACAL